MGIEEERKRIDEIDAEILKLLGSRLDLARRIGREKRDRGVGFYDPVREREVIERIVEKAGRRFPSEGLRAIYREIISASRALETDRPVLYLGAPGSLAHEATRQRFGDSADVRAAASAEAIFERIDSGEVEYAVLTLEASTLESHLDRLDLFLHSQARIFGEFYVIPRIGLYAPAGVASIRTVFAHPAVLARASRWVEREAKEREFIAVGTSEDAADRAAGGEGGVLGYGVLAGRSDLALRERGLEDEATLFRRFLILGCNDGSPTGRDKTSCLAVIPNRPGGLCRVAEALAAHGVNLCWIEPKATPIGTWDHIFFLDLEGHRNDEAVRAALEAMRGCTDWMKVLGSYPSERPPGRSFG